MPFPFPAANLFQFFPWQQNSLPDLTPAASFLSIFFLLNLLQWGAHSHHVSKSAFVKGTLDLYTASSDDQWFCPYFPWPNNRMWQSPVSSRNIFIWLQGHCTSPGFLPHLWRSSWLLCWFVLIFLSPKCSSAPGCHPWASFGLHSLHWCLHEVAQILHYLYADDFQIHCFSPGLFLASLLAYLFTLKRSQTFDI